MSVRTESQTNKVTEKGQSVHPAQNENAYNFFPPPTVLPVTPPLSQRYLTFAQTRSSHKHQLQTALAFCLITSLLRGAEAKSYY